MPTQILGHSHPPTVEEIVAVMRAAGQSPDGLRVRALIIVLWRAGLRISEALALAESDLDRVTGAVLVRRGKGGKRREVGMDRWGWQQIEPWLDYRPGLPVGRLAMRHARADRRSAVVVVRGTDHVARARCRGRGAATLCATSAPPRARGRDGPRGRPADGR